MFGVRRFCGIHIIYTGAVIRGDRQGLFYGKFEASRCGTHLLTSGFTLRRGAAQAGFFDNTATLYGWLFIVNSASNVAQNIKK